MKASALAVGALRDAIALFGHVFLFATQALGRARAVITAFRESAAKPVAMIALSTALVTAAITGAVSAGYAAPLAREPGDVVYLPTLAIRADGRLALPPSTTIAEAAAAYAGPAAYWSSTCRATLPGWYRPVDWQGLDAVARPLWRASISGSGVVEVSGLGPAETDSLRALLEALAPIVACD
jgi:hypothetical protein